MPGSRSLRLNLKGQNFGGGSTQFEYGADCQRKDTIGSVENLRLGGKSVRLKGSQRFTLTCGREERF